VRIPPFERVDFLSLQPLTVPVAVQAAPTRDAHSVALEVVAIVKVASDAESLNRAAERFLGMPAEQVQRIVLHALDARLHSLIARLEAAAIAGDRLAFEQLVAREAGEDLGRMGLAIDVLAIRQLNVTNLTQASSQHADGTTRAGSVLNSDAVA
jgi:uncharacterized membrane protein YqiK